MPDVRPFEAVIAVKTKIYITLSSSTVITLDMQDKTAQNLVTGLEIVESTGEDGQNPAGVVSPNTLKISLNSLDNSLIPENSSSPYYGYMNDSARIRVEVTVGDGANATVVNFRRFFVKDWSSSISTANPHSVTINATCQLGVAMLVPVPKSLPPYVALSADSSTIFNEFMQATSTLGLSGDTRFVLPAGTSAWDLSNYSHIHYYPYADNISNMLNIFRQSLLYDMYNNRNGEFIVRDCLDFNSYRSDIRVDDGVNVIDAKVNNTDLTNLNCIKCSFDTWSVEPESQLVNLTDQTIESGESTAYNDVDLGGVVSKITQFKIDTQIGDDQVSSSTAVTLSNDVSAFTFSGTTINFRLLNTSTDDVVCSLIVYGQKIRQSELTKLYGDTTSASKALQINNRYILENDVDRYLSNLYKLQQSKAHSIVVTGYFNPTLQVGDVVDVDLSRTINIEGRFKVQKIAWSWSIGSVIKGTLTLTKVVS